MKAAPRRPPDPSGNVLLRINGRDSQPPELPTFALGTDAQVSIDDGNGVPRAVQIVLPKAEPGKANAKPPMAEPTSVTAREIQPGVGYVKVAFSLGIKWAAFCARIGSSSR